MKTEWLKVARSMEAQASKQNGQAIVTVRVLVNKDGVPVAWTTPSVTKIEPKASEVLIHLLCEK